MTTIQNTYLPQDLGFLSSLDFEEKADHLHSHVWWQLGDSAAAVEHGKPAQLLTVLLPVILEAKLDAFCDVVCLVVYVAFDSVCCAVLL